MSLNFSIFVFIFFVTLVGVLINSLEFISGEKFLDLICRGFINVFTKKANVFYKQAKLFELSFLTRCYTRQAKSLSKVLNILGDKQILKPGYVMNEQSSLCMPLGVTLLYCSARKAVIFELFQFVNGHDFIILL